MFFPLAFLLISCFGKDPRVPDGFDKTEIDVNDDGIIDYEIKYRNHLIISPLTNQGVTGFFKPKENNFVLDHRESRNLFLMSLDEVEVNVSEPLFWNNETYFGDLVWVHKGRDGEWPNIWTLSTDINRDSYWLGLKFQTDQGTALGYVELTINSDNGEIIVIDQGTL